MIIVNGLHLHSGRTCPFEIFSFVQKLKQRGYIIPKIIEFKDTRRWGYGWFNGSKIQISSNLDSDFAKAILLHELVHTWGNKGHNEKFWLSFVTLCEDMDVCASIYFRHPESYASGKKFWSKYKKGLIKTKAYLGKSANKRS